MTHRNPIARDLAKPHWRKRVVASKKVYSRKRRTPRDKRSGE